MQLPLKTIRSACCRTIMRFLLRSVALALFFSKATPALRLPHRMQSSPSSSQVMCNVTPAAIASFPPLFTTCISNARDVSAAKLNDVSTTPVFARVLYLTRFE
jgi:hypothetical protein